MRRVVGSVAAGLLCMVLLTSCSLIRGIPSAIIDDSDQQTNSEMQRIADAVNNHDVAALKHLFSPLAQEAAANLDSGLKYFMSLSRSGRMTWKSDGSGEVDETDYGKETTQLLGNFKVSASGKTYQLHFLYYSVNTLDDPNNVGLYGLGMTPYAAWAAHPRTASGAKNLFDAWGGSLGVKNHIAQGAPGVYVPKS